MANATLRTSFSVAFSVWRALVLREALSRLFGFRAAWFWVLFEPVFHVAYLMVMFVVVRIRHVGGFETPMWIMVGLLSYFHFQRIGKQAARAVISNSALFAYRQVKPVDTVIARSFLECALMLLVSILLLAGASVAGLNARPGDPLRVLAAWGGLALCGFGFALTSSVLNGLSSEVGKVLDILTRPLYLISGVIFPIHKIPPPFRDWLMYNPILHGVEAARSGYAPYYHAVPGVDLSYVYFFGLSLLFLGFLLQVRFEKRLVMQ